MLYNTFMFLYLKSYFTFQVHKIIGFAPNLLQVVMMTNLEMPVRQAGVIYMKNMVSQYWQDRESEPGKAIIFAIHEQDRAMIRDAIVDAVVYAPELIRQVYLLFHITYFILIFLKKGGMVKIDINH